MNVTGWMTGVVAVMVLTGCATSSKSAASESNGPSPPSRAAEVAAEPIDVNVVLKWDVDASNAGLPGDAGAAARDTLLEQLKRNGVVPIEAAPIGMEGVDLVVTVVVGRAGDRVLISAAVLELREGALLGRLSRSVTDGQTVAPVVADMAKEIARLIRDWKQGPRA